VREFARLGLTRSVGGVLSLALARELSPVVTAIIMAGRVGSAFAAELGNMHVPSAFLLSSWNNWCKVVENCCSLDAPITKGFAQYMGCLGSFFGFFYGFRGHFSCLKIKNSAMDYLHAQVFCTKIRRPNSI
jgi:hypothetical protein